MSKARRCIPLRQAPYIANRKERWDRVIDKWEAIVKILKAGKRPVHYDAESCAFCRFDDAHPGDLCTACPIGKATDSEGCGATPYKQFSQAMDCGPKGSPRYARALEAAKAELKFLRELRKKEGI